MLNRLWAWLRARLQPQTPPSTCQNCGLPFDAATWQRRNERRHYHGRYTITPVYTCPRCRHELRRAP